MGMRTIREWARCDPTVLADAFGELGKQLHLMAYGLDNSEVQERSWIKSISRESTFQEDTTDFEAVLKTLDRLSEEVVEDVLRQRFQFRTITIRVRYENFETHMHGRTLSFITNRLQDGRKRQGSFFTLILNKGGESDLSA